MATFNATDIFLKRRFMGEFGNASLSGGVVASPVGLAAADVLQPCIIPAGSEIVAVILSGDQLDSNGSPTLVVGVGYAPVSSDEGALAASAAYFAAAGQTFFRVAEQGRLLANFAPIKFEQDVYLTLTVGTAAATKVAGNVRAQVLGSAVGIK